MDDIEAKAGRMKLWLDAFKGGYVYLMPYSAIATGVLVVAIIIYALFYQSVSPNEQKAIDARTDVTISNVNTAVEAKKTDEAVKTVREAEKTSQKALKRSQEARQGGNSKGVPFNVANAERCSAYPEDCK